jgi:hypothetical protein
MELVHYLLVFAGGMLAGGGLVYWKYSAILAEKNALISSAQKEVSRTEQRIQSKI